MNQDADLPDYPRFLIAAARRVSTIRSPKDGQEGLAAFWTKAAAKKVARSKPGTVVVEATPEMFVEALRKANEKDVPWLYIGTELGDGVDFRGAACPDPDVTSAVNFNGDGMNKDEIIDHAVELFGDDPIDRELVDLIDDLFEAGHPTFSSCQGNRSIEEFQGCVHSDHAFISFYHIPRSIQRKAMKLGLNVYNHDLSICPAYEDDKWETYIRHNLLYPDKIRLLFGLGPKGDSDGERPSSADNGKAHP